MGIADFGESKVSLNYSAASRSIMAIMIPKNRGIQLEKCLSEFVLSSKLSLISYFTLVGGLMDDSVFPRFDDVKSAARYST